MSLYKLKTSYWKKTLLIFFVKIFIWFAEDRGYGTDLWYWWASKIKMLWVDFELNWLCSMCLHINAAWVFGRVCFLLSQSSYSKKKGIVEIQIKHNSYAMCIETQSFQNERKRHEIKKWSYRKWHYERKVTKN